MARDPHGYWVVYDDLPRGVLGKKSHAYSYRAPDAKPTRYGYPPSVQVRDAEDLRARLQADEDRIAASEERDPLTVRVWPVTLADLRIDRHLLGLPPEPSAKRRRAILSDMAAAGILDTSRSGAPTRSSGGAWCK